MAIIGPAQLPLILKLSGPESNALKKSVLSQLGHPVVMVEINDDQFEEIIRIAGDFIAQYFPLEEKFSVFWSKPGIAEYDLPSDAYWVRSVAWDPTVSRLNDIFGAESFLFNIGNISGIQNLLTDYNLLLQFRRFSQRILGNEGQWDFRVSNKNADGYKITLRPVPKGAFPIIVEYMPAVTEFKSGFARYLAFRAVLAQTMMAVGLARNKYKSIGGENPISFDDIYEKGSKIWEELPIEALKYGEPPGLYRW